MEGLLSGQGELHADTEVGGGGGVGRLGDKGDISLPVEEAGEREQTAEGIVGRDGHFIGSRTTCSSSDRSLDVAVEGILQTVREVGTEVEVVTHTSCTGTASAIAVFVVVVILALSF